MSDPIAAPDATLLRRYLRGAGAGIPGRLRIPWRNSAIGGMAGNDVHEDSSSPLRQAFSAASCC